MTIILRHKIFDFAAHGFYVKSVSPKNVLFRKMRRRIRSFVAYYRTKVWEMFKNNVFDSNMAAIKCRIEYYSTLFR